MPVQVKCPNPRCGKPLSIDTSAAGQSIACPHCKASLHVANPNDPARKRPAATPPDKKETAPKLIGEYQLRGKLGEGAFGIVYRAFDPTLERDVAIKLLRSDKSDAVYQRFLREAKVMAQLQHPHIVPVFQLGRHEGSPFIASAFIAGNPLSELIVKHQGVAPRRAVNLTIQLLDALAHAHDRGVVHRDVKPSNAMVDPRDQLYLMDFGLAGWDTAADSRRMTQDGSIMGTPAYMPPEQAGGQINLIGKASDQYSAGVVLYELLTGHLPFEGAMNTAVLFGQILHAQPPPLRTWQPDVDPELEAACLLALAKAPGARYPGCREFGDRLRAWLKAQEGTAPIVSPPTLPPGPQPGTLAPGAAHLSTTPEMSISPTPPATPEVSRRSWLLAGGVAVVSIIAAGGYVVVKTMADNKKKKTKPEKEGVFKPLDR